jgi:predicted MFS family arabinose efflux permease
MTGVAASTSIALTGLMFDAFGRGVGFLIIGGVAAVATAMVWMLLPETKPEQYQD